MQRPTLVIVTVCVIIALLLFIRVSLLIELGVQNGEYALIEQQIRTYRRENSLLREKVLQASSLQTIQIKAIEQGFVPITPFFLH